jgi:hypothetical protein
MLQPLMEEECKILKQELQTLKDEAEERRRRRNAAMLKYYNKRKEDENFKAKEKQRLHEKNQKYKTDTLYKIIEWRAQNPERVKQVAEAHRRKFKERMEKDPEYKQMIKEKRRERYLLTKEKKKADTKANNPKPQKEIV